MDLEELEAAFDEHEEEFLKFDRVSPKRSARPDIHAFLLLDELFPNDGRRIVAGAEHDIIYLDVQSDQLLEVATEERIIELTRCGVFLDEDTDSLALYV